jgi:arylsulfatase A-like enzyme
VKRERVLTTYPHGGRGSFAGMKCAARRTVAALALLLCDCAASDGDPPNVVLIVVDTLRADRLPLHGYERPTAPSLERLAEESLVFDRAFTVMSHTLPSHVSLVTGIHPATHQVLSNGWVYRGPHPTLATRLREAGYATAAFVSGFPLNRGHGIERGFDLYEDTRGASKSQMKVEGEVTNRRVLAWLRERGDGPFFLMVHYYDLHTPYTWPKRKPLALPMDERFRERAAREGLVGIPVEARNPSPIHFRGRNLDLDQASNLYDNQIRRVDGLIEEIRAELEARALLDHTLLVITADHGEGLGDHGYFSHGLHLYEEQLRVPLIVRPHAGSGWKPGRVASTVSLLDITPTVLEAAGLEPNDVQHGRSLGNAVLADPGDGGRRLVAQRRHFRKETAQASRFASSTSLYALRGDGPLKYLRDGRGKEELFDLRTDPRELDDLARDRSTDLAALRRALDARLAEIGSGAAIVEPEIDPETGRLLEALGYVE